MNILLIIYSVERKICFLIDFCSRKIILWKPMVAGFSTFFKISTFGFNRRNPNRFGTSEGWENDDRIYFWVNCAFKKNPACQDLYGLILYKWCSLLKYAAENTWKIVSPLKTLLLFVILGVQWILIFIFYCSSTWKIKAHVMKHCAAWDWNIQFNWKSCSSKRIRRGEKNGKMPVDQLSFLKTSLSSL